MVVTCKVELGAEAERWTRVEGLVEMYVHYADADEAAEQLQAKPSQWLGNMTPFSSWGLPGKQGWDMFTLNSLVIHGIRLII